ncbi:MAG: hypothetical protein UV82_C0012G0027 [Candidatus Magasanikbacteria bacterium GW2011_GWD2_43_18]|uniref:Uncharacterized protein n=1 Tax=Candidatus Magasanikbacteria bacterium GW2011_GWE2_42_7 TaxID=1619052 RepID=A0A0G1BHA4_9BACT|nr:MAG: hypothetical protein UV18_C0005G0114 [Candidatus Magasanikbacteria bacterium GW2011_GWC2_42_27]KKS72790.1 MAG: hypothetical protein UV42_C0004G0002 [Candidatus Magasanikbacteria bacterium GW2011_GWE2_42_7]KKT04042.1 MAG: hypothetical protein UV82_C0012G0027 [Candidatus Magasanikbacteria bacterium GW2011_GWD2_43_18]KKT25950.1 MAG: hypothetical protein UW10_C0003G0111 [Candidatus Magasanikbacteria bacterium GW2011_GWA2_43_9]HBB37925.1 hypothetical protein [Candidatus Magasanikbacteria bac
MKKFFYTYSIVAVFFFLSLPILCTADNSYGLDATADAAHLTKYGKSLPTLIGNVVGTALSMISVIFFALMIYGGFRWMLSRGKEDDAKKALDTIIAAIIGIIIVLASYAITTFVFQSVNANAVKTPQADAQPLTCKTPTTLYVNTVTDGTGLAIVQTPSAQGTVIATMPDGEEFEKCSNALAGPSTHWGVVKFNNQVGWANVVTYAREK